MRAAPVDPYDVLALVEYGWWRGDSIEDVRSRVQRKFGTRLCADTIQPTFARLDYLRAKTSQPPKELP